MPINNPPTPPSIRKLAIDSFAGDNGNNRQITTGFKCSMVVVIRSDGGKTALMIQSVEIDLENATLYTGGTAIHATDGFIVSQTTDLINGSGLTYRYWAIGA